MSDIDTITQRVNTVLIETFGQGAPESGNNFEWIALHEGVRLIKIAVDSGVGDVEKLAQSAHKAWCMTVQDDLENKLTLDIPTSDERKRKRHLLSQIPYEHYPELEKEKYRLMARTLLS